MMDTTISPRSFSLGRSISRKIKPISKKVLPEEKLSVLDDNDIKADEKIWYVKMSAPGNSKKVERILAVGPNQLRLLLPDTYEEVGKFPYRKMNEFSHNESYKMFQFSWFVNDKEEEIYYFKTSKCREIQLAIGASIKELLRKQHIENPEAVLRQSSYMKPIDPRAKAGGRQRSVIVERIRKEETSPLSLSSSHKIGTSKSSPQKLRQSTPTRRKPVSPGREAETIRELSEGEESASPS